jgi:hypothetical protein
MSEANDRTLRIVVGYVPRVDRLPLDLRDAGLVHRTAFAVDTRRADRADMWFDAEIYLAVVDAIPWVRVGGPAPYHDTWTIAMHTGDDVARVLAAEAMGACADAGALVEDVVRGSQRPDRPDPRIAIRERLRRLWRRIALGISPRDLTVPLHVPSPRRGSRR